MPLESIPAIPILPTRHLYRAKLAYELSGDESVTYSGSLSGRSSWTMFKAPPRSGHFWDIARLGPPAPASEREKLSPEALALGQDALWPVLVSLFRDFVPSWGERIAHHPDIGFGLTDKLRIELCAILGAGSGPSVITGAEFSLSIYPERILAIARRRDAALLTRNQVTNPLGSLERKLGPDFTRDAWHCFDELENELIYLDSL